MEIKSDTRIQNYACDRCGNQHEIKIDFATLTQGQLEGREPVLTNFKCPDIAVMYRVVNFNLDTRVTIFKQPSLKQEQDIIANILKNEWGILNFDDKLKRYIDLDLSFLGIPEEYYKLLWPVVSSYCCGLYYPAMTSSGALGERILNRLIIKTRDYFKSSVHYKKIYRKDSFDQWDLVIKILKDWDIISNEVSELFLKLKVYRNDSIHYNDGYDFEKNSHDALKFLAKIIDTLFNYVNRRDLFWVFDVPGEIWVKSSVTHNPFVKEFVLPNCLELTPFCEPLASPPIIGKNAPIKPLTDEEFIRIRNNR